MKKRYYIALGLMAFMMSASPISAKTTVVSQDEMLSEVSKNWEDNYYQKITIDDGKAEKDGEQIDLSKELDITKKQEEKILSSDAYAKNYFEKEEEYEVSKNNGKLEITSPYQTHRIVVNAIIKETYGAESVYYDKEYQQTVLQFSSDEEAKKACEAINKNKEIAFPDTVMKTEGIKTKSADNLKEAQSHGVSMMGLDTLKKTAENMYPDRKVLVAVIDSGYNASSFMMNGRSVSKNSKSFVKSNPGVQDTLGHGCHVSGIIAEGTSKQIGFLELKVTNKAGETTDLIMAEALKYAIAQNADVANISIGGPTEDPNKQAILEAVTKKANNKDLVMVAAAGNEAMPISYTYPASDEKVWAITSISSDGIFSAFSNYGKEADFCAPGENIWGAAPYGKYTVSQLSGTSMSTPHITAAAAMVKLKYPKCSIQKAYNELKSTCHDYGKKGKDARYGWGLPKMQNYFDKEDPFTETKKIPSKPSVSVKVFKNKAVINWSNKNPGATYILHVWNEMDQGYGIMTKKMKGTSYTFKDVSPGILFKCYVEAFNGKYYSAMSSKQSFIHLEAPRFKVRRGKRNLKVLYTSDNFKNNKTQLLVSKNKSFKKAKKYTFSKQNSKKTIKKLRAGKKYYLKMRAGRKIGKKTYWSKWSKVKSVRTR